MEDFLTESAPNHTDEDSFKNLILRIISFWPLILATCSAALIIAFIVNQYAQDTYEISATVHLKENDNPFLSDNISLAFNWGGPSDLVESHVAILESYTHNYRVAKELGWEVSYFSEDRIREQELYKDSPFRVEFDSTQKQLVNAPFLIDFKGNSFALKLKTAPENLLFYNYQTEEEHKSELNLNQIKFKKSYQFNEWIENDLGRFKIIRNNDYSIEKDESYFFNFNTYLNIAKNLKASIIINKGGEESTLMVLSAQGPLKGKLVDFINSTIDELRAYELEQKNQTSVNTIKFIDSQLVGIIDTLKVAEDELKQFRSANKVVNLDSEAQEVYAQYVELEKQKGRYKLQGQYYQYLQDYIKNKDNYSSIMVPSVTGIDDPVLIQLIEKVISLSAQLARAEYTMKGNNPLLKDLRNEIAKSQSNLKESVANLIERHELKSKQVNDQLEVITQRYANLPKTEQSLINLRRKYEMSNEQYIYLIQKRSEAGISSAANTPETRVIEPAMDIGQSPIAPSPDKNYALALALGLIFPLGYIFTIHLFDNKIRSYQSLENKSKIPILGLIGHANHENNLEVLENSKSSISEGFRTIRSNMQFLYTNKKSQSRIILITSSIGGEGKTFCAINLASIISMAGSKTILLGLDLRKPKIFNDFGLSNDTGLTSYLAGRDSFGDIIQPSGYKNLDIISAGPIPPNPSELILSDTFKEVIEKLREQYEYIIIDTPPVGIVADSLELMTHADVNLYVVRQDYTKKESLQFINDQYNKKRLRNISLLLNDVQVKKGYGYSYGYGQGYGYGYFEEEKKKKRKKKPN